MCVSERVNVRNLSSVATFAPVLHMMGRERCSSVVTLLIIDIEVCYEIMLFYIILF